MGENELQSANYSSSFQQANHQDPAPSSSWQEVHVEFLHVTLGDKVPYNNTENKLSVAPGQICCSWYVARSPPAFHTQH